MFKELDKEFNDEKEELTLSRDCDITGKLYSVTVPLGAYLAWQSGDHVQNVFPDMSVDNREFLISGTTPREWKEMFNNTEEDD